MRFLFALLVWVAVVGVGSAQEKTPLGRKVADFTLQDYRGKGSSLAEHKDAKLVVVAFLGTECPLAKLYGPKLGRLAKDYAAKGVVFLGIDSNAQDSVAAMAAYARIHEVNFPFLKDPGNKVADQFGVQRTPTVYLLDGDRVIRYLGRIDDQYGISSHLAKPRSEDLVNAIKDSLGYKGQGTNKTVSSVLELVKSLSGALHKA